MSPSAQHQKSNKKKPIGKNFLPWLKDIFGFCFSFVFLLCLLFVFSGIVKEKEVQTEKPVTVDKEKILGFKSLLGTPSYFPVNQGVYTLGEFTAKSAITVDVDSMVIIFEKNADMLVPPASTTKIMTSLIALDNYSLDTVFKSKGWKIEDSISNFFPEEKITVENLLYSLLIGSANDAAEILAENFPGGREVFVGAMNKKAKELGLTNTRFTNPVGYDEDGHFSTARDLAKLSLYAIRNPFFSNAVSLSYYEFYDVNGKILHRFKNTNELLGKIEGVRGIKTGLTQNAGECLVALIERNGRKEITIVLGSSDRFGETKKLISWVFDNFNWQLVLPAIH